MQIPFPVEDRLFLEQGIYDYLLPMEYAESCCEIGQFETAAVITAQILESGRLSLEQAERVARCRNAASKALHQGSQATESLKTMTELRN